MVEDYADGQLWTKLERITEMQMEHKHNAIGTIARFTWELGVLKHNILNEENSPKAHLIVYIHCNERGKRLDGWSCKAKIKFTLESTHNTKSYPFDHVSFPMVLAENSQVGGKICVHLPWDKLISDFHLQNENDSLLISAKISIIEQQGYGSLIQLNTRLAVREAVLLVNKYHLATYSSYFQAFFFSEWSKDKADYELNDPDDDIEALQLMFQMAYPVENYVQPAEAKIAQILQLADKYDLPIVSERCERYLMTYGGDLSPSIVAGPSASRDQQQQERPPLLIQRLALAERYNLFSLKTHCLERISPAHFCAELRDNIAVYQELSEGLKAELDERLAKKSSDELHGHGMHLGSIQQHQQEEGTLPPPHKRVRPRPKTPPRPNYNLPPFRFK